MPRWIWPPIRGSGVFFCLLPVSPKKFFSEVLSDSPFLRAASTETSNERGWGIDTKKGTYHRLERSENGLFLNNGKGWVFSLKKCRKLFFQVQQL